MSFSSCNFCRGSRVFLLWPFFTGCFHRRFAAAASLSYKSIKQVLDMKKVARRATLFKRIFPLFISSLLYIDNAVLGDRSCLIRHQKPADPGSDDKGRIAFRLLSIGLIVCVEHTCQDLYREHLAAMRMAA